MDVSLGRHTRSAAAQILLVSSRPGAEVDVERTVALRLGCCGDSSFHIPYNHLGTARHLMGADASVRRMSIAFDLFIVGTNLVSHPEHRFLEGF
ncbi:hypothetical protein ES703_05875 [subsurface metagenome]